MTNLTIAVEEDVVRRARIRALEQGTSVNQVLREFLEAYSRPREERIRAFQEVLAIAARNETWRGNRTWTRDELHERR
jgi:plasmid stability protein